MKKRTIKIDILAVVLASIYLFLYCVFLQYESTRFTGILMLGFAPFVVAGMVLSVLIYGKYKGGDLGDREFGYSDKDLK
jgi:hypothetical protein